MPLNPLLIILQGRGETVDYWNEAVRVLGERDAYLRSIIEKHRTESLSGSGDAFTTLANAIVGQQISVAAAAGIWKRLIARYPSFDPATFAEATIEDLRGCGLSLRKAEYLTGLALAFRDGSMREEQFVAWSDDEVRDHLTALRGIGPWTAEMFLIFHLKRPDVMPLGDIGLQRAARRLYGWPENETPPLLRQRLIDLGETWRPFRTVAVWYLWRDLDAEPVVY